VTILALGKNEEETITVSNTRSAMKGKDDRSRPLEVDRGVDDECPVQSCDIEGLKLACQGRCANRLDDKEREANMFRAHK
jgi:hypothetical protein